MDTHYVLLLSNVLTLYIQEGPHTGSKNNVEKEQSWKTHTCKCQNFYSTT